MRGTTTILTQGEIQNVAAEVYLEKGFNLEIGDIAKKAGLGRGTVYHYYNNKINLLEELLHQALEEAKGITIQTICINECPLLRLTNFSESQLKHWIERPYLYILFKNFFQTEPIPIPNYETLRSQFFTHIYSPIFDTIKEGIYLKKVVPIDPETTCQFYFSTLIGLASGYFNKRRTNKSVDTGWMNDVIKLLVRGIAS